MKTLLMNSYALFHFSRIKILIPLAILGLWMMLPKLMTYFTPTAGVLDGGILQLIFLSLSCYFILIILCWWLLRHCWQLAGLPTVLSMVSQFKILTTWQQLGFYWASFALLLLAGVGCLAAIF